PADLQRSGTWGQLAADGDYLTVINQHFTDPGTQILSDFTFAAAPEGSDFQQVVQVTRMREILSLPAGPVLVVLIRLLAATALGYALGRRPARRGGVVPRRGLGQSSDATTTGR